MTDVRNIVLVHGGFADGSDWRPLDDLLTARARRAAAAHRPDERRLPAPGPREAPRLLRRRPPRRRRGLPRRLPAPLGRRRPRRHRHGAGLALQALLAPHRPGRARLQRTMATNIGPTVSETPGSHAVYISRPEAAADVVREALAAAAA